MKIDDGQPRAQQRFFKGYSMIARLTSGFRAEHAVTSWADRIDTFETFQPSDLQDSIDCIRQLIGALGPNNELILENARCQLQLLQGRRDALLLADVRSKKRGAVNFEEVISVVVSSGLYRSASYLREGFHLALNVCVKDASYRRFLQGELRKQRHLSATVIKMSRLKIHMALCLKMQYTLEDTAALGPYMVFRTIDLTPDRGVEWVLYA